MEPKKTLYTVIVPMSGAAVLQFVGDSDLTDNDAVCIAIQGVEDASLKVINGGSLCDIKEWELHEGSVDRGNVCYFSHTSPDVYREDYE